MAKKIKGQQQLERKLAKLESEVREGGEEAVRQESLDIVEDAQRHVAIASGDLHDSIAEEVEGLSATVAPRPARSNESAKDLVIKAYQNEFGSSWFDSQPYMVPASERSRKRFPQRMVDEMNERINRV